MTGKQYLNSPATVGSLVGGCESGPLPIRQTEAIKSNLRISLDFLAEISGTIAAEERRLMGPRPCCDGASEQEKSEGDIPEILYLTHQVQDYLRDIRARLSFLSEI